MEYLVLTGFSLLILMILLVSAYTRVSDTERQIGTSSLERTVLKIVEAADFVYIHGHPTKLEISVYLPGGIDDKNSFFSNKTINFAMGVDGTHTDVWHSTRGDVEWDIEGDSGLIHREGYYTLNVESTAFSSPYNGTINIYR